METILRNTSGWNGSRAGLRGGTGGTCPGPPSSKGPPATEKKTIIIILNNAMLLKFV